MQRRKHFKLSETEQKIRYIKHMSISFVLRQHKNCACFIKLEMKNKDSQQLLSFRKIRQRPLAAPPSPPQPRFSHPLGASVIVLSALEWTGCSETSDPVPAQSRGHPQKYPQVTAGPLCCSLPARSGWFSLPSKAS